MRWFQEQMAEQWWCVFQILHHETHEFVLQPWQTFLLFLYPTVTLPHTVCVYVSDTTLNDLIGLGYYLRQTVACSEPSYTVHIQCMSLSVCVYLCNRIRFRLVNKIYLSACVYVSMCVWCGVVVACVCRCVVQIMVHPPAQSNYSPLVQVGLQVLVKRSIKKGEYNLQFTLL